MSKKKVKGLEQRRAAILDQMEKMAPVLRQLQSDYDKLRKQAAEVSDEIAAVEGNPSKASKLSLRVSEHAVMRYITRVLKVDMSKIKRAIATKRLRAKYAEFGDGAYRISDDSDLRANIVDGVVVTVYYREGPEAAGRPWNLRQIGD